MPGVASTPLREQIAAHLRYTESVRAQLEHDTPPEHGATAANGSSQTPRQSGGPVAALCAGSSHLGACAALARESVEALADETAPPPTVGDGAPPTAPTHPAPQKDCGALSSEFPSTARARRLDSNDAAILLESASYLLPRNRSAHDSSIPTGGGGGVTGGGGGVGRAVTAALLGGAADRLASVTVRATPVSPAPQDESGVAD